MKYNLVHGLLSVETNKDYIYYFPYALWLDTLIKGQTKHNLGFYVLDDIQRPKELSQSFDYYWGATGSKKLYYEHFVVPGLKAKLLLDMSSGKWNVYANRTYYRFSRYKFENVWPPGRHFTSLVSTKLLENNILPLHSAAISSSKTNEAHLILGASNTGKSLTTFKALEEGYEYHSEDITILDKNYVYKTPLISAMSDKLPNKNFALQYNLLVSKLTGINMLLPRINNVATFRKFFKDYNAKSRAKLKNIFILERGEKSVAKLRNSEAIRKIILLNRIELHYYRDHMLRTYNYFNSSFNIKKLMKNEEKLVEYFVENAKVYLLRAEDSQDFWPLMRKVINEN